MPKPADPRQGRPVVKAAEHPLHELAMQIRYDLTGAQSKLTELMRQVGELDLSVPGRTCEVCGYRPAQNMPSLSEHMYTAHNGPLPAHWDDGSSQEAEAA